MRRLYAAILSLSLLAAPAAACADAARARQDFILNCQGCHLPDGRGTAGAVPQLRGFVGKFLHVPGGREYLIRVPGVASAPVDNESLARLMNWMLREFSANELPSGFTPYTADEVGALRLRPLDDVHSTRAGLLEMMPP